MIKFLVGAGLWVGLAAVVYASGPEDAKAEGVSLASSAEQMPAAVSEAVVEDTSVAAEVARIIETLNTVENEGAALQSGLASFYGRPFHGRRTASGEIFNMTALTAAHPTLPFGTQLKVTNTHNQQTVVVRINDRGPYKGQRIIDLSQAAAAKIGMLGRGLASVVIEVFKP